MKKRTESDVIRAICDYLALKNYVFWRQNNVGVWNAKTQGYRRLPMYCKKGIPDIFLLDKYDTWGLEVKSKTGALSSDQRKFKKIWEGFYRKHAYVRSVDDVRNLGF